jgi:excisionase family DNA binding protein
VGRWSPVPLSSSSSIWKSPNAAERPLFFAEGGTNVLAQQSPFYRVREVAQILRMSEGAVRQRIRRRQIPVTKLGGSVLVPRAEFDAMVHELLLSARR